MPPNEIRAALRAKGLSPAIIADAVGFSEAHVYHVISRRSRNRRIARALAQALGVPPEELFPEERDYYTAPDPNERRSEKVARLREQLNKAGIDTSPRKRRQRRRAATRAAG